MLGVGGVATGGDWRTACAPSLGSPSSSSLPPDKQSLRSEPSVVIVSCKDGRQLLSIPWAGKRHAGLYECSATNVLGSVTSSCTVAVAREPGAGTKGGSDGGCRGRARWALNGNLGAHWGSPPFARCPRKTSSSRGAPDLPRHSAGALEARRQQGTLHVHAGAAGGW